MRKRAAALSFAFDAELRRTDRSTALALREVIASGRTPPAEYERRKCDACSLLDLCRPKISGAFRQGAGAIARSRALDDTGAAGAGRKAAHEKAA